MRFRTTGAVYLPHDRFVEAGVEIGDNTAFPLPEGYMPSVTMEGLDEEAKQAITDLEDKRKRREMAEKSEMGSKIERLERENAQLQEQLRNGVTQPTRGPFRPRTSTGPSQTPQNINKEPEGAGHPSFDADAPLPPMDLEEEDMQNGEREGVLATDSYKTAIPAGVPSDRPPEQPIEERSAKPVGDSIFRRAGDQPTPNPNADLPPQDDGESLSNPGPAEAERPGKKKK